MANSIAMMTLPVPSLIVINATNYLHHIPDEHMEILTPETLAEFLNQILQNDIQVLKRRENVMLPRKKKW